MYAIIATGGKQYRVAVGEDVFVEKLELEAGQNVELQALAISDENGLHLQNELQNSKVVASVVKQGKNKKIYVMRYTPKKRTKRKQGHRQPYTRLHIESITL